MLAAHILIAVSSLILASVTAVSPGRSLLRINYVLSGLTLATGTYLVVAGAPVIQSCLSGIVYLAAAYVLLAAARTKLARLEAPR